MFASAAEIVRAVINAFATGMVSARLEAGNSANTEGLLAALLVVAALHAPIPRKPGLPPASILIIGLVGLLMFAFARGDCGGRGDAGDLRAAATNRRRREVEGFASHAGARDPPCRCWRDSGVDVSSREPTELKPVRGEARPRTARSLRGARGSISSSTTRIFGVGWQQSPVLITSPAVINQVTRTFGDNINPAFIPKQGSPLSVHNLYVQILAEGGLLAFVSLLAFMFACAAGIRAALRAFQRDARIPDGPGLRRLAVRHRGLVE